MHEPPTPQERAERIRIDRRRRWRQGDRVLTEAYLQQDPTLAADPSVAVEVIYHEILLREELGEAPQLDEYLQRFPHLAAQLQPLFEVEAWLQSLATNWPWDPPNLLSPPHMDPRTAEAPEAPPENAEPGNR